MTESITTMKRVVFFWPLVLFLILVGFCIIVASFNLMEQEDQEPANAVRGQWPVIGVQLRSGYGMEDEGVLNMDDDNGVIGMDKHEAVKME